MRKTLKEELRNAIKEEFRVTKKSSRFSWISIPNVLTLARIFMTPFIVFGIIYREWSFVFGLLVAASLSDVFDGYVARRLGQRTEFGAWLDPVADKFLLISSFAALSFLDSPSFSIPLWFLFLIFMRETIIVGGFLFLFVSGIRLQVAPSIAGKLTTFFQLSFILWIFICYFLGWNPVKTYSVLLVFLSLFSLGSLCQYSLRGIRYLKK